MIDLLLSFAALSVAVIGTVGDKRSGGALTLFGKGAIGLAMAIFLLSAYKWHADSTEKLSQAKAKRHAQQVGHREVAQAVGRVMDETLLDSETQPVPLTAEALQKQVEILQSYNVKELSQAVAPETARLQAAIQAFGHYLQPDVLAESQELINHSFLIMLRLGQAHPEQTLASSGFDSEEYEDYRKTGETLVCRIATDRKFFDFETRLLDQAIFDKYVSPITVKRSKKLADGTWKPDPVTLKEYLKGRADLHIVTREGKFVETCTSSQCDELLQSKDLPTCLRLLQ